MKFRVSHFSKIRYPDETHEQSIIQYEENYVYLAESLIIHNEVKLDEVDFNLCGFKRILMYTIPPNK